MRCNLTTNEHVRDYYIDRRPLAGKYGYNPDLAFLVKILRL
jgi:hypothetical protein